NNAVVYHGDLAAAADLGVGIDVAGCAMGRPAGMADANHAVQILTAPDHIAEDLEAALGLLHLQLLILLRIDRHTGAVIAPILQALETIQQDGGGLLLSYISYDSAHSVFPPVFRRARHWGRSTPPPAEWFSARGQTRRCLCLVPRPQPLCPPVA